MIRIASLMLVCAAVAGLSVACDDDSPAASCSGCTEEFRSFTLTVLDAAGSPVADVTLVRVNLRTGKTLEPTWLGLLEPGVYPVADDGLLDEFSVAGDRLRVTGTKGAETFVEEFVFGTDACRCHVLRVSGRDTVTFGN